MKVVYLDTSVLMAMLCPEPETDQVLSWFARADGIELVSCPWSRTELASALAIKQRTKQLSKKEVELAGQKGLSILASARCEQVETIDFDEAAVLCAQSGTNLRAPDALHLSVAMRTGCTALASMDVEMQKVAKKLGLRSVNFSGKV